MMGARITFASNPGELDLEFVAGYFASRSYLSREAVMDMMGRAVANSFCLGIFLDGAQIGFARVVTDYETHAYVTDVFIAPQYQRKGYGKRLIRELINHPRLRRVRKFCLRSQSAGSFYESIGFKREEVEMLSWRRPLKEKRRPRQRRRAQILG